MFSLTIANLRLLFLAIPSAYILPIAKGNATANDAYGERSYRPLALR
ncbi:hypothetical protein B6N60_04951 [Richelia sinica FACHB-800]|nr:hypothetical protein B6N60_00338 [Richelia sinica FACHB-800]QXE25862.1 hypothetical protein B6N60_04582 [Richelia sinica FACHB-800]QXE26121.1 hypothetical protein B6N60_04852 [Richelia sinica FACHB-800]QXE26220.1 hypothetical protein B6N60_04951 [Richelia sinica FACHB-800]